MDNNGITTADEVGTEKENPAEPQDLSVYVPPTVRKPGEIGFTVMGIIFGILGYYFAMDMTSQTFSSPSVFPKLSSAIIIICGLNSLYKVIKREPATAGETVVGYLLPRDVTFMILMIIAYSFALPKLHFIISSYAFMVVGMIYLHRGKKIIQSFIYSAIALAILVAVFRYLFLVILP